MSATRQTHREDRQWFKAEVGRRETPLAVAICTHALFQPDLFVGPDTLADARFACNPLVTGWPHLRFYAGALVRSGEGLPVGTERRSGPAGCADRVRRPGHTDGASQRGPMAHGEPE